MSLDLPRLPNPIDEKAFFQVPFNERSILRRTPGAPFTRQEVFDAVSEAADLQMPLAERWMTEECKFEEILWMKCLLNSPIAPLCTVQRSMADDCLKDRRLYIAKKRQKWINAQLERISSTD